MRISAHEVQHASAAILATSPTKNSMLLVGTAPLDLRDRMPYRDTSKDTLT
jgi:hypothetical protein